MKNKKLLAVLLTILKGVDEKKLIEASEKEDGDDSVLKEFIEKHNVFSLTEVETLKKNAREEGITAHYAKADFDIDKDIPSAIAGKLLGRKLEGKQIALAKKYEITDAKDIDDLIEKLVIKYKEGKGNPDQELEKQIVTLKQAVLDEQAKVKAVEDKYVNDEINRTFTTELTGLPLKIDDDKIEAQRRILTFGFNSEHKLEKKGETIIVLKKKGDAYERVNDKLGEPVTVKTVLTDFAKGLGLPFKEEDPGGRGEGSSKGSGGAKGLKGLTFEQAIEQKNATLPEGKKLSGNSTEMAQLRTEWKAENPN